MKTNRILLGVALAFVIYLGISSFGVFSNIKGSGNVIKESRQVEVFHAIDAGGAFHITLKQGDPQQVVVEADDNIVPIIVTKVHNGVLKISQKEGAVNAKKLNIYITVANIDNVDISGACQLTSDDFFKSNHMEIECSGAAIIDMKLSNKELDLDCSGAGKVILEGEAKTMEIEASGASKIDCDKLSSEVVSVNASGASKVSFVANKLIDIDASGASEVVYQTTNAKVKSETSGAADITRK